MSLRRKKFPTYNRMEEKEEVYFWLSLVLNEDIYEHNCWYCCEECDTGWWYDAGHGYGNVNNMDEYHQMKLLGLLRKLNIRTATEQVNDRGW